MATPPSPEQRVDRRQHRRRSVAAIRRVGHAGLVSSELFVGRAVERQMLADAVEAARQGRSTVVWISGAAGSGKSAFVRRVLADVPPDVSIARVHGDRGRHRHRRPNDRIGLHNRRELRDLAQP
jgi:hypothetical protein